MPCYSVLKFNQTQAQRNAEVEKVISRIDALLAQGRVRPKINKTNGAIAFEGISDRDRDDVTDICIYRRIMVKGSALARASIQRAEMLAGRTVDKKTVAQGVHSHDGGKTWHQGH